MDSARGSIRINRLFHQKMSPWCSKTKLQFATPNFAAFLKKNGLTFINLEKPNDLVIKTANKDGAIVVWRTDLYQQEAIRQLSDPSLYSKVNKDLTSANQGNHSGTHNQTRTSTSHRAQNLIITTPKTSCINFISNLRFSKFWFY